jgi:ribonuclease HI
VNFEIWGDGSSCGNSLGPGGWCALLKEDGVVVCNSYGGEPITSNNAMELQAVIGGIEMLMAYIGMNRCAVESILVVSDSYYIIGAFNDGWIHKWKSKGWVGKGEDGLRPNARMFMKLDSLVAHIWRHHGIKIEWAHVDGHTGVPENEYCDKVAKDVKERIKMEVRNGTR